MLHPQARDLGSLEKFFKLARVNFGIALGRRDPTMAEILLNSPDRLPIVHQLVAGSMAEHVRVHRKGQSDLLTGLTQQQPKCSIGHRATALRHEHERAAWPLFALQPAQRPQLFTRDRMLGVASFLVSVNRQQRLVKIDLVPSQADQLVHAQAVPEAHYDHRPIAMPVATAVARSLGERFDFNLGQVLTRPPVLVFCLARRNSSEKRSWRRIRNEPESGWFPHVGIRNSSEKRNFRKSFAGRGCFTSLPLLRVGNYIGISHCRVLVTMVVRGGGAAY